MEIEICGLEVECVLGDLPEERAAPAIVCVDARLELDDGSGEDDDLAGTVDYAAVCARIRETLSAASCRLLERAARIAADACAAFPRVAAAEVRVAKSGSLPGLRSAAARCRAVRPCCGASPAP